MTHLPDTRLFSHDQVRMDLLRQRAYNQRWAMHPDDVIPLTAADPDFPVALEIRQAIRAYAEGGVMGYGPPEGLPEFRETAARVVQERHSLPCAPDLIFPTDSAAAAMFLIARTVCSPGDEAILFDPVDFLFGQSLDAAGVRRVYLPIEKQSGTFDLDELASLVTPTTRMICLCNPHNPLGRVFSREELTGIGQLAVEHDLMIMSDEVWCDIIYPPHEHISIGSVDTEIAARTITVFGLSKGFGIAGLRIGFLVAPDAACLDRLIEASRARTTASGVSTLSQVAAQAVYDHCWYWVEAFLRHLQSVRDYAVERLNRIEGITCRAPEGTYVLFPDITQLGMTSQEVADHLLQHGKVAVVPGLPRWFGPGAEGNIRLCFSTSVEIVKEGIDRIEKVLAHR